RNPFLQADPRARLDAEAPRQRPRRLRDEVRIAAGHRDSLAVQLEPRRLFDLDRVREVDRAETGENLVKPVRPASAHPQLAAGLGEGSSHANHSRGGSAAIGVSLSVLPLFTSTRSIRRGRPEASRGYSARMAPSLRLPPSDRSRAPATSRTPSACS